MQHEIQELKEKIKSLESQLASANAKIVELETKLEERSDCHNGLPAHAWYSKLSTANKKAEKLVEAINIAIERINDGRNNDMTIGFLEQAIKEFRGESEHQ